MFCSYHLNFSPDTNYKIPFSELFLLFVHWSFFPLAFDRKNRISSQIIPVKWKIQGIFLLAKFDKLLWTNTTINPSPHFQWSTYLNKSGEKQLRFSVSCVLYGKIRVIFQHQFWLYICCDICNVLWVLWYI